MMDELKDLIETIRCYLQILLEENKSLLDPDVIYVSKMLDKALNMYYRMSKIKMIS